MTNQPDMSVVAVNSKLTSDNHKTSADGTYGSDSQNGTLRLIKEESLDALSVFLKGMFDGIDDSFFELANSSRNNNEQNRFFEAMREVRIKRKGIENGFARNLSQNFIAPPKKNSLSPSGMNQQGTPEPHFDTLALVQNDELEEDVAIKTMNGKARANFQSVLLQLEKRFQATFKQDDILCPLDPVVIIDAFIKTCQNLDLEIREKLIVYKQFDRFVLSNIGDMLDIANLRLIKMGILPDLKLRASNPVTPKSQSSAVSGAPTSSIPQNGASTLNDVDQSHSLSELSFSDLQDLLNVARGTPNKVQTSSNRVDVQYITNSELINLLSGVQTQIPENELLSAPVELLDIRKALQALLKNQKKSEKTDINQIDEDLINLVSMLFEFILDDYNLSAPIQVLISRLQIPLLKVVIRDNSFFSNAKHPARQLLNSLARAGIGWADASEKQKDKLYNEIHQVVHRILSDFNGDITLFSELNEKFSAFMKKEERKSHIIEQRTREAEKGRIKSQRAQQEVEKAIRSRFDSQPIPSEARDIIQHGWSRVMFLAYLKNDNFSSWNKALHVLDELTWCLSPQTNQEARQRWVKVVPILLKEIRIGLQNVSYNSVRLDDMLSKLKDVLSATFKQPPTHVKPKEPLAPESPQTTQTAVQRQKELENSLIAENLEQVDLLQPGSWIEFSLVNGSKFRCKLSAHIDEGNCLIFVNRMGLKVVEKTREELALEMRKGRVKVLEQGMLFDRALNSVISGLRKKTNTA
jgi:hypothetical protein